MENINFDNKFYKVAERGSTYICATFYNPTTDEEYDCCVRDYDYADGSRDNDVLYYMAIDERIRKLWQKKHGCIYEGATIKVVKGRKVPIGTIATVRKIYPYKDIYGRIVAYYAYLDNGMKTNVDNCVFA